MRQPPGLRQRRQFRHHQMRQVELEHRLLQGRMLTLQFWSTFFFYFPFRLIDIPRSRRHSAFLARLQSFASNPTTAVPAVKAAIRGYRAAESSARDLITTIWNVLDCHLDHTASIVNAFVDLLEEEDKKTDLLGSWKGFELEVCGNITVSNPW